MRGIDGIQRVGRTNSSVDKKRKNLLPDSGFADDLAETAAAPSANAVTPSLDVSGMAGLLALQEAESDLTEITEKFNQSLDFLKDFQRSLLTGETENAADIMQSAEKTLKTLENAALSDDRLAPAVSALRLRVMVEQAKLSQR